MASDDRSVDLIATGVAGLDNVLMGGLLRGGFYLVQGDPGSGKTTLALQIVQASVKAGVRCLYVTLTESRADLEATCRAHGWTLDGVELRDLTRSGANLEADSQVSVFHPADTELTDITRAVLDEVKRVKPQHVVFDGLSELRLLAAEPLRYRRTLLSFKELFAKSGVTAILLDDRSAAFNDMQPESLVGANIVLERFMPSYGGARRRLYVTKVRGMQFRDGYHDYEIVTGGLVVHPRLVAGEHPGQFASELFDSGIANLDAMLCGGLSAGSTTLLLGPAGAGKSTTAMQFVANALRSGKKAAVYIFDEVMHTLLDRSEKLNASGGESIRAFLARGALHLQQVDPAELSPGGFAHEVKRAVDEGARVVVIDSLNGYLNAMPDEGFLATHLHELFAYLNQNGILTIMVVAQHGMIASGSSPGGIDISYLADSVLLFRYFEAQGQVNQAISVFKKRTGPHERTIRELTVNASGVSVGEPLRQFRGIMTGVPQYQEASVAAHGPRATDL